MVKPQISWHSWQDLWCLGLAPFLRKLMLIYFFHRLYVEESPDEDTVVLGFVKKVNVPSSEL